MSTQMKLDTFYRIDGTSLTDCSYPSADYPLNPNYDHEPIAYIDGDDNESFISGFYAGDHNTFASNEDFNIPESVVGNALTFRPHIHEVEALLPKDDFKTYINATQATYVYLTQVLDQNTDEPLPNLYNMVWVALD